MADTFSKEKRSWIMSRIKGKDTVPEMVVRRFLHANGFRYRLHVKELPGKPDIVLPKYKTIILVHGCFWHGHKGCTKANLPKTRTEWWQNKISHNSLKDTANIKALKKAGWQVIVVWQCDLKPKKIENALTKIIQLLENVLIYK